MATLRLVSASTASCMSCFLRVRCESNTLLAVAAFIAVTLLVTGASAQRLSFGMVAGGYGNGDFDSHHAVTPGFLPFIVESESGGGVVGPSLDVRLFRQLSVGAEALYKPLKYRAGATFQNGMVVGYAPATVITWQFPVLARYRLPLGPGETVP